MKDITTTYLFYLITYIIFKYYESKYKMAGILFFMMNI